MKAQKITVRIEIEVLSIDSVRGLAYDAINQIYNEKENGMLRADDGDEVKWETIREDVQF